MKSIQLTAKENLNRGTVVRRLWKNYCRGCNGRDMNILGIVEENVKKDDVAVIKILALDVEYTAVQ